MIGLVIGGTIGLVLFAGWIDSLLLDWVYFSSMNLFVPNLLIVIPCLLLLLGVLNRRYSKASFNSSTIGLEWSASAGIMVGVVMVYFLGILNLGAYLSFSPYILPRSNFLQFFVPFFLFMLALEGIVRGVWWSSFATKVKLQSPKKEIIFLIISLGIVLGMIYILSLIYNPIQMALGLLNPQMLLLALSALAVILGWIFYGVTKNWVIDAFMIALFIAVFMSALFPAF
jgi:hypothetical protein